MTDVIIIGDGVIALSTALELDRAGATCLVVGDQRPGAASGAAAGLLAPSVGHLSANVAPFFFGSLALYPEYLAMLRPLEPGLHMLSGLTDVGGAGSPRFYPADGAIDNAALMRALRAASRAAPGVRYRTGDPVVALHAGSGSTEVVLAGGEHLSAELVVLAAGAWSPHIAGLPRPIPVTPLKGQMLAVAHPGLDHALMSDDVYLVPRDGEVVIGATSENAGFDVAVNPETIESLRQAAIRALPALRDASVLRSWAGIRPATPDLLPIIGPDPDHARLIYACGHSRNGILLAPATARAVASLAAGGSPTADLTPFSIARFEQNP